MPKQVKDKKKELSTAVTLLLRDFESENNILVNYLSVKLIDLEDECGNLKNVREVKVYFTEL